MSFIFCDAQKGDIIDIIEDRRLSSLFKYFQRYSKAARSNVKIIVMSKSLNKTRVSNLK